MKPVVEVQRVGKQYALGERERYESLRENISRRLRSVFSKVARPREEPFWAIRDVSFDVSGGQVVGIVGRNGAGKSTLLKILSRIAAPTEGRIVLRGRVGSLLEVGVGFHPELTGRENIFLNGAILGMRRAEIQRKFDEIVAFAEVDRFLDTPVKRYSSGMYVRLAFSVAAHLEPEILLVDEVLAVGDVAFQKKCLGKMGAVSRAGRTVLFVSHNMVAVSAICERGILLERGQLVLNGTAQETVDRYLRDAQDKSDVSLQARTDRKGNRALLFTGFELRNARNEPIPSVASGEDAILAFRYETPDGRDLSDVKVAVGIHGKFDESLFHVSNETTGEPFERLPARGVVSCKISRLPLQPGSYSFNLFCTVGGDIADWIQNAGALSVEAGDFFKTGRLPIPDGGPYLVDHAWTAAEEPAHANPIAPPAAVASGV